MVNVALACREAELVSALAPNATEIANDLLGTPSAYKSPPKTIEELLSPFR